MSGSTIDLRSDTVTLPSAEMLAAISSFPLGDSLRDEDPTVNDLQERSASMFNKEEALLLISGTMTNQVAVNAWCRRGSIVIAMESSHIARKESVSVAAISGCSVHPMEERNGLLETDKLRACLENPEHLLGGTVGLVTIENSVNAAGGIIYPLEKMREVYEICREFGLPLHIDGSRIFNSLVEEGTDPEDAGDCCDSLTYCLSKGLGAPLGSVLVGSEDFIFRAKESRNLLGGGMRQAGVIAACGIYALENNVERLRDDHENARLLAKALRESGKFQLLSDPVETNMVLFTLADPEKTGKLREELDEAGVLIDYRRDPLLRAVTNLNHSRAEVKKAGIIIAEAASRVIGG